MYINKYNTYLKCKKLKPFVIFVINDVLSNPLGKMSWV